MENKYDKINKTEKSGLRVVTKDGLVGAIDKNGTEVVPCKYLWINDFVGNFATVGGEAGEGLIDVYGNEIMPCKYDYIGELHSSRRVISLKGKHGYASTRGQEVIECKFDKAYDFEGRDAIVGFGDKFGILSLNGKMLTGFDYDYIGEKGAREYRPAKKGQKWGFLDEQGQEVIPFVYDNVGKFRYGFARVTKNGKKGYVDLAGGEVFDPLEEINLRYMQAINVVQTKALEKIKNATSENKVLIALSEFNLKIAELENKRYLEIENIYISRRKMSKEEIATRLVQAKERAKMMTNMTANNTVESFMDR